jgi:hypothetical protein
MLDFLSGQASDRKLRLFAVACCRGIWHLMTDERSRTAVQVAEAFADRRARKKDLRAARLDAERAGIPLGQAADWAAVYVVDDRAFGAAHGASEVRCSTDLTDEERKRTEGIGPAFLAAGRASQRRMMATLQAVYARVHRGQVALLRDVAGNPFRPVSVHPSSLTTTVKSLACAAYDERVLPSGLLDSVRLQILADALEESGCSDPVLLAHLRGPGPHVRGCFAVDALLGKS